MPKRSMSYLDLIGWIGKNKELLRESWIDNIYNQPGTQTFIFKLRTKSGDRELLVEPGKRIHFTQFQRERGSEGFVGFLRTLIKGAKVQDVELLGEDRIVNIITSNENNLIVELIPKGVLVVTDKNGVIVGLSERRVFKDRKLEVGVKYIYPPKQNLTEDEVKTFFKKGQIWRILNISPEEVSALMTGQVTQESIEELRDRLEKIKEILHRGEVRACYSKDLGIIPFIFPGCSDKGDFDLALDEYFKNSEEQELIEKKQEKIENEKQRILRSIEELQEAIKRYGEEEGKIREVASYIMKNSEYFNKLLDDVRLNRTQVQKRDGKVEVEVNGVKVFLDPTLTSTKNASLLFNKAKEFSDKIRKSQEVLGQLEEKLKSLQEMADLERDEVVLRMRKKQWFEKYRWTITSNGFLVIAGRDIDQNESIVRKMLEEKDIFLHADLHGAPATIIKTNGKEVTEADIKEGAVIAACYSKAWKALLGSIDIYWVNGSQVSKTPPSGEYLSKGSFMIYGKKNYIKNVKLELSIGLMEMDGLVVFVGSEDRLRKDSIAYVTLVPDNRDEIDRTVEKVIKIFERSTGKSLGYLKDEILRALPGKSAIVKSSLFNNTKE